jgi:hypothetical protein
MPSPSPLDIAPGIIKVDSDLGSPGRWIDGDGIRFVKGRPEKIGGWRKYHPTPMPGVAREQLCWESVAGVRYVAVGSHTKLYVYVGQADDPINITPARDSGTLGSNPFVVSAGNTDVRVTKTGHGVTVGDGVTLSGVLPDPIGNLSLNGDFTVTTIIDADHFTIGAPVVPTTSATTGGSAVAYVFEISPGRIDAANVDSGKWGVGGWGIGVWGGGLGTSGAGEPRFWSLDLFGSLLLASPSGGTLYSWNPQAGGRATAASGAPAGMRAMFVTEQRFVHALGTSDAMVVQWPSQESLTDWTPSLTNTANSRKLQYGTRLMAGSPLSGLANLLWTDSGLYLHTYTGSQFVFESQLVGQDCGLVGPNAYIIAGGKAFWMGPDAFFSYIGYVDKVPRQDEIATWLFANVQRTQVQKTVAIYNPKYNEAMWFYPPTSSTEPGAYVAVDLDDFSWSIGTLSRTATARFKTGDTRPIMIDIDGNLFLHEAGTDALDQPYPAFIQAAAAEIEAGSSYYDVDGFIPDFVRQTGDIEVTLVAWDRVGRSTPLETATRVCAPGDKIVDFHLNGRAVSFLLRSNVLGGDFRLGVPKASVGPGRGRRR